MKKTKILKRVVAVSLVATMMLATVGCGNEQSVSTSTENTESSSASESSAESVVEDSVINEGYFPIVDEPITITVAGMNKTTNVDWNKSDTWDYISNEMNINLDCTSYASDAWKTQYNMMLVGDTLPDLIVNAQLDLTTILDNGSEGYLLPINEYLDYAPNLKAFLEEHEKYANKVTAEDGNIYALPLSYKEALHDTVSTRFYINKTWLDNVGMDEPKNVDELYDVLKAFKEKDANGNGDPNDEIPYCMRSDSSDMIPILSAFGLNINNNVYGMILDDNGEVILAQTTDNFRAYLSYVNKLYEEGLIDEAGLTQKSADVAAKVKEGRAGVICYPAPYIATGTEISEDANWAFFGGLTSEWNQEGTIVQGAATSDLMGVVISSKTEHPEAIMRLLDFFFTEEGALMAMYGTEKSVKMVPNEFDPSYEEVSVFIPTGEEANYASAEAYQKEKATLCGQAFTFVYESAGQYYNFLSNCSDEQLASDEVLAKYGWAVLLERKIREVGTTEIPVSGLSYTEEEAEERSIIRTDFIAYLKQVIPQFISGALDPNSDADWNGYLEKCKELRLDDLMEIENSAYDRIYGK